MKRVLTYGTFDLLHYGHINLLKRAKALGDYLVVAVSTDDFNELKGKKAYHNYETRKMMLEAVRYVDLVIPEENWEKIFDAFYTTSKPVVENMSNQDLSGSGLGLKIVRDIVESYGGTIRVVPPIPNYNTTIQIKIPQNK